MSIVIEPILETNIEVCRNKILDTIFIESKTIFVVYIYKYNFSDVLKAFYLRQDAVDYQRYYQNINYERCYIKEIDLE